jgi:hypothetical protein
LPSTLDRQVPTVETRKAVSHREGSGTSTSKVGKDGFRSSMQRFLF